MPREKKACAVCAAPGASYACPRCRAPYCCVACCRRHRDACGGRPPAPAPPAPAPRRRPATTPGGAADDDPAGTLTDAHRARLSGCDWLRAELRSEPSLRALLRRIEAAADPAAALGAARGRDARFAAFVDGMLVELGICDRDGDGEVTFRGADRPLPAPGAGAPARPLYHGGGAS